MDEMTRRKRRVLGGVAVLAASLLLTGCLPIWEAREMQQTIDELEARQGVLKDDLEAQEEKLKKKVENAREKVEELKGVLAEARQVLQRNNADLGAELQSVRNEIQKLRGKLEEAKYRVSRLEQTLTVFESDVDMRFAEGGFLGRLPEEPVELLKYGKEKLDKGQIAAARQIFDTFLQKHTEHARADDAQYFKAMTFAKQGKWKTAVHQFKVILDNYPRSNYAGDATYQIGKGFMEWGRCKNARAILQQFVEQYPGSQYDSEARTRIRRIDAGQCAQK